MRTAQTRIQTPRLGRVIAGLAIALAVGAAATPALADNDRHRDQRGGHHGYGPPGHNKHHGHGHYYGHRAPVYYYAPPPPHYAPRVYYAPPRPVYYYPPPSPGLTLVFPLGEIF